MSSQQGNPKNQHYVPQFILRNFSTGKKKRVYVYDKLKEKTFLSSTRNIASENGFYDLESDGEKVSFEPLMTEIESKASRIFKKIIHDESLGNLTEDERITISIFSAVQQLRVTSNRHKLRKLNDSLRNAIIKRGIDPNDHIPEMDDHTIKLMTLSNISQAKKTSQFYFEKSWILYKAPKRYPLYISDNPIALHNLIENPGRGNLGLKSPGVEIYLPISKQFSICFLCSSWIETINTINPIYYDDSIIRLVSAIKSGDAEDLDPENVLHQNSLQVINSSRFIYSAVQDFELVQSMIKQHPHFKYPPEVLVQ